MDPVGGIGVKYVREIFAVEDSAGTYIVFFEAGDCIPCDGYYLFHQHDGWCTIVKYSLTQWDTFKAVCARLVAQGIYTQRSAHIPLEQDFIQKHFLLYFGS